jgi:hypothetical protein
MQAQLSDLGGDEGVGRDVNGHVEERGEREKEREGKTTM